MTTGRGEHERAKELFAEAIEVAPSERGAFLERRCDGDGALLGRVRALLRAHEEAGEFMESPTIDSRGGAGANGDEAARPGAPDSALSASVSHTRHPALTEGPGTRIGPYKLLQQIGEGGFGVVYMAAQTEPVKRKVALKIIKLGMDTRQVIARFEAERQALAMMEHPNIAKVLDAGATETGRPYFVMELVKGVPITEYCDTNGVATRARLELFMQVCFAVQHAHTKGVIHRDIKPSNVLVTLHDGRPVPKIIDFGIAKATNSELTEKTVFTEFRQLIGTPEYMSPEQAEMSGLDVDTRADIYSLGVLLYELLTGTTPFEPKRLRSAGYAQIQKIIREEDPPRPSTRVDTLVQEATRVRVASGAQTPRADTGSGQDGGSTTIQQIARSRHTDPGSLGRLIRGDLDWIVMKCLEKDRTRRYETASALAADIQKHLEDQPVDAGPPSASYRLRKLARRHRATIITGSALICALVVALVGLAVGLVKAASERDRAVRAEKTALADRDRAIEAERQRRLEAEASRAKSDFFQGMLLAIDPTQAQSMPYSVEEVVESAREVFGEDHAAIGAMTFSWGSTLRSSGQLEPAERVLRMGLDLQKRDLGPEHPMTLATMGVLADVLQERQQLSEAETMRREVIAAQERSLGGDHVLVAQNLASLAGMLATSPGATGRADEIQSLWARAIEAYKASIGPDDRRTVHEMCKFGGWLFQVGRQEAAEPVLAEAVERGRRVLTGNDESLLAAYNWYLIIRFQKGDYATVKQMMPDLIGVLQRTFGAESMVAVQGMVQHGMLLLRMSEFGDAERVLNEAAETARRSLPETDPVRVTAIEALVDFYESRQNWTKAQVLYEEFVGATRTAFGETSGKHVEALAYQGRFLTRQRRFEDAEAALTRGAELAREYLGSDDPARLLAVDSLTKLFIEKGDVARATPLYEEAIALVRSTSGGNAQKLVQTLNSYGAWLADSAQDLDRAERVYRESVKTAEEALPKGHPDRAAACGGLIQTLVQRPDRIDPEWMLPFWLEFLEERRAQFGSESPQIVGYLVALASWAPDWGQAELGESLSREALAIQEKAGASPRDRAEALVVLAIALNARGDFAGAERAAREALEARSAEYAPSDWRVANARSVLGESLMGLGRAEEAEAHLVQGAESVLASSVSARNARRNAVERVVRFYEAAGRTEDAAQWRTRFAD